MAALGNEITFELDNFQKPHRLSLKDTVVQSLINLFFMRPGNLPSKPHIGLNIPQYLYATELTFNAEEIKAQIYNQCSEIISYISLGEIAVMVTTYKGQDLLLFSIPIKGIEEDEVTLLLGLTNTNSVVDVLYQFENK